MSGDKHSVVTVSPSGRQFSTQPHTSLLESGLSAGLSLPYRCSNGSCGDCRARIVSGKVETTRFHDYVLSTNDKSSNVVLLCCNRALTDLTIEISEAGNPEDIPRQRLNTRVCHMETVDDTIVLRLKILRGKALWYLAGQYAMLHLPNVGPQLLPIASCPCEAGFVEFHLPLNQYHALADIPKRERVLIDGPVGNFTIDDTTLADFHHVFVTTAHQFAAVKPMIEHITATDIEPQCTLLWAASSHYKDNLCRSWNDAFDWFCYQPLPDLQSLINALDKLDGPKPLKVYYSVTPAEQATLSAQTALINAAVTVVDNTATTPRDQTIDKSK